MEEKQNYIVYMHKNKINDKVYIGITGGKPKTRWRNGEGYIYNEHFYRSIKKYGWNKGFEHIILFDNLNKEEAEQKEIELIKFYNSTNPDKGYNIQKGGNLNNSKTVYQYDRYSGIFIKLWENTVSVEKELGIPNTNVSIVCLGKMKTAGGYYFSYVDYGKKLPEDIIEWINTNEGNVKVAKYSLDGKFIKIFDSAIEAARTISDDVRINFNNKINFGYIWKKVEDENFDYTNDLTEEEVFERNHNIDNSKECYQYNKYGEFMKSYPSTSFAAESLGLSQSHISSACRGNSIQSGGYYWKYAKDAEYGVDLTVEELDKLDRNSLRKPIYQYDKDGKFIKKYKSVTDAANAISCSTNEISKVCMRKNKTAHGYIFRYEGDTVIEKDMQNIKIHKKKRKVNQYDMEHRYITTYESLAEASRKTGANNTSIVNCIKGIYHHANHYLWEYADEKIDV